QLTFNQIVGKKCLSCGMPMSKAEDFGGGNPANVYCVHCAHSDGSLKKYEEAYEGMIGFMMSTQNMDRATAEKAAKEYMATMPAWQGK
ncbi:MAG: zinc ribbon domain-containing protein, partial [Chloroflexota bacterium]